LLDDHFVLIFSILLPHPKQRVEAELMSLLVCLAGAIEPALNNLDSVKIGPNHISKRKDHEGWRLPGQKNKETLFHY
jgi:hypothetical protein